ncbi:MAG: class I SAM-dependent methyltransferase [Burkholderiales bacterium]|nr:class I SAM-dependent methyltransferase [Burkholderiales bacterium]
MNRRNFLRTAMPAGAALAAGAASAQTGAPPCVPPRTADVVYEPTPLAVVDTLIAAAAVGPRDVVFDLGCGDGRFLVAAARRGATGVGFDLNVNLVEWAQANALAERVDERVRFEVRDLFTADLSRATVVTLYLLPELNLRVRPKLWKELAVGARVVSNAFDMGDWQPDRTFEVPTRYRRAYLWTIRPEHKRA